MISRRQLFAALAGGATLSRLGADASFPATVVSAVELAFHSPGNTPNGLQATKDGLWVLDQGTNRVALVRYADGSVVREFATETDRGSGITFDGSALWIASTYKRLLVRVDAKSGRTLQQFPSPDPGLVKWGPRDTHPHPTGSHGLEWRRGELWVANPPSVKIYVVNPADGRVMRSFPAPGVRPHGIGWDADGSLWCAESIYRSFFKIDPETGLIKRQVVLPPAMPQKEGMVLVPHGMTVWDQRIWFSVAETGEIYRLSIPA
jgi:DNA-binding beta-propeller fold protein YncE